MNTRDVCNRICKPSLLSTLHSTFKHLSLFSYDVYSCASINACIKGQRSELFSQVSSQLEMPYAVNKQHFELKLNFRLLQSPPSLLSLTKSRHSLAMMDSHRQQCRLVLPWLVRSGLNSATTCFNSVRWSSSEGRFDVTPPLPPPPLPPI